jgi:hypothetical protein
MIAIRQLTLHLCVRRLSVLPLPTVLPRPFAARPSWLRAGPFVIAAIAALLAGCGGGTSSHSPGTALASSAVLSSATRSGCPAHVQLRVVAKRSVGIGAGPLAVAGGDVWVARPLAGTITRVSPTGTRVVDVGGAPVSLAAGFGKLWVAERDAERIERIDLSTLARSAGAGMSAPVSVVAGPSGVWALSLDAGAIYPINPANGGAGELIYAPVADPSEMVMAGEDLWLLGAGDHGLSPVNAKLGRIVRAGFALPGRPLSGLSAAAGTIWLGEPARRSLLRVDAATGAVQELPAPDRIQPTATVTGACGIWVAGASGELVLADSRTATPLGPPLRVGRSVAALAPTGTGAWVTDPADGTLVHVEAQPAS